MRFVILLCIPLCVIFSFSASAEYYKYVDKNGVTRYTDDLSQVPKQKREELKKFKEIKSGYSQEIKTESSKVLKKTETKADNSKADELRNIKKELDEEYQSIKAERENLITQGKKASRKSAVEELNVKAAALNKRIEEYEKKKEDYIKRVKEYNTQLENRE